MKAGMALLLLTSGVATAQPNPGLDAAMRAGYAAAVQEIRQDLMRELACRRWARPLDSQSQRPAPGEAPQQMCLRPLPLPRSAG